MRLRFWMVLTLLPWAALLMTAMPASADIVGNTLSLSDGSAPTGAPATVTLDLANEDAVGGIQLDILFDTSVAVFSSIAVTDRSAGMTAEGRVVESGRLRVVLYYGGSGSLASDTGSVAELVFSMQGAADDLSTLVIEDIVLSDPDGAALTATGTEGSLTVDAPSGPPVLSVVGLKNPGNTTIIKIMVTVAGGSGGLPTVTASGDDVIMSALSDGLFLGQYVAAPTQSTLSLTATATNDQGTGTDQVTLALP